MAMSDRTEPMVRMLDAMSLIPRPAIKEEVRDAEWADFGRMVSANIFNPDFLEVLTRAGLKSKGTGEMLGYIRAFILTGAKP